MVDIQPYDVSDDEYSTGKPWLVTVDRAFNKSITVDPTLFTDADHTYTSKDGRKFIKSGVPLAESVTEGVYGPAAAGTPETPGAYEGVLFSALFVPTGSTRIAAPLMTHGAIRDALVPGGIPADTTGPALIRHDA